jgi:short-subunit dehydrogenase
MKLQGRKVWLIGASSGLGEALVAPLLDQGVRLAISARREDTLGEIAARYPGREILVRPLDVTQDEDVRVLAGELWQTWDGIDVVIYCPGTWQLAGPREFETASALNQIDVNYLGLVRVCGAVMRPMIERRRGEIVGITSLSGYAGFARAAAYSSSKAGAIAFLQSLRIDLSRYGVGVTTVVPGFFESRLTASNQFRMPDLMTTEQAAEATLKGLLKGEREVCFPWRLAVGVKLLTRLPRGLYEVIARRFMSRG